MTGGLLFLAGIVSAALPTKSRHENPPSVASDSATHQAAHGIIAKDAPGHETCQDGLKGSRGDREVSVSNEPTSGHVGAWGRVKRKRYVVGAACCALLLVVFVVEAIGGSPKAWITELLLGHEAAEAARAQAKAEWRKEREQRTASLIAANWRTVANTTAVAMSYEHGAYQSSLVKIGGVATPANLNLIATDYRCGYCRVDEPLVREMMRARPGEKFIFIESAILGTKSRELAAISLGAAELGNYAEAHRALFELSSGSVSGAIDRLAPLLGTDSATLSAASHDAARILDEHMILAALLEIKVTPTYVLDGQPRIGVMVRQAKSDSD
ncbi:MAG TPA: hypothetical protein VGQ93_12180 [Lysobacter sp.]|nr:hypothetical protein [Lysobacter sp.]